MNDRMRSGMAEALRLTRAGKLAEATAIIRRTLEGAPSEGTPPVAAQTDVLSPGALPDPASGPTPAASGSVQTEVQPKGRLVQGSYANPAGERAYTLYIPSGYVGQALPLVVMLHGCTQTAADCASGTRLTRLAEEDGFLVVFPEQAVGANKQRCWNWFRATNQRRGKGEPSLIAGLTREIMASYAVDARRVYVAGLSAGGAMAAIMAATYPDLYAAVGVHSGLANGAARDLRSAFTAMRQGGPEPVGPADRGLASSLPTIVFHGDRDTTVHPRNGQQVLAQALPIRPGDGLGGANGSGQRVTTSRGQGPGGHAYTRSIYRDAGGRVVGEYWLVHGAGHAWSGGSPDGSFTDPRGPDASREMLRFFREHSRAAPETAFGAS